jgi:tetratricopeptide (TPR) repeat protein
MLNVAMGQTLPTFSTPVIRLDPKDAEAYYNRGLAWKAKDDLDRAIADFDQAGRCRGVLMERFARGTSRMAKT